MNPLIYSVQTRLMALCLGLVVVLGGANLILGGLIQQDQTYQAAQQEQFQRFKVISAAQEAMTSFRHARGLLNSMILVKDEAGQKSGREIVAASYQEVMTELDKLKSFDPQEASEILAAFSTVQPVIDNVIGLMAAGQPADTSDDYREYQRLLNLINDRLNQVSQREHQLADDIEQRERQRVADAILAARFIVITTALLGGILTFFVVRSIIRPLRATNNAIRQVNAGETRIDLPRVTRDEFGDIALALRQFRDRAESLHRLAYEDALTGLGSRAQMDETLRWAVEQCRQNGSTLALFYMDLDNFRSVNDRFGHLVGDRYICEAAARLRRFIPEGATLYRYGGDNFVVLLDELQPEEAATERLESLATLLLRGLSEPYSVGEDLLNMSVSIGIAVYPADGASAEQLVSSADSAMFSAKRNGRNNARFASALQTSSLRRQLAVYSDIRRGLERGEFHVFYQPVIDTRTQRVVGAEALLRWRHPEKGLILPGEFIAAAEESGLINRLGEVCLRQAHAQALLWRWGGRKVHVAVNLSVRQLMEGHVLEVIASLPGDESGQTRPIEFELTESVLLDGTANGQESINEIHRLGYRLSLDDFGTGYSSFSYLERLPIDKIKIDRSFVTGLGHSQQSQAIVSAMLAMSTTLSLDIVGEGVETEEESVNLRNFGCYLQQGFLFSKALPADEFGTWADRYAADHPQSEAA
jgi:diguanylate cyclase (GGDEF)-like protein